MIVVQWWPIYAAVVTQDGLAPIVVVKCGVDVVNLIICVVYHIDLQHFIMLVAEGIDTSISSKYTTNTLKINSRFVPENACIVTDRVKLDDLF
jgi:citrate lyase synthetase